MKRSPIRPRKTLRKGEPSPAEKHAIRLAVRDRAHGVCELRLHPNCPGERPLPLEGGLYTRGHLVHLHGKRRFGFRESEQQSLLWGCGWCHCISLHHYGEKFTAPDRPILVVEGF